MSEAQNDNVTELEFQNLRALVESKEARFVLKVKSLTRRESTDSRDLRLIVENKSEFALTTKREFNVRDLANSVCSQFASKVEAIDYSVKHLKQWMKPEEKPTSR